jgi:phenol 2-monooxygenase (NADPH)
MTELILTWSLDRAFVDQQTIQRGPGGTADAMYGISSKGAIVVIRPDSYIGTVAPLDKADHLDQYFGGFMNHLW